ncbi:MAG: hypothetical protein M3159_06595, partial [Actinomycetota bacterium]|nr:hypothetical protein [Actinomycetota bacterium]
MPEPAGALLLALQYQLEQSERWPAEQVEALQLECLGRLLGHAVATVPFYAERAAYAEVGSAVPLSKEAWSRLPVL